MVILEMNSPRFDAVLYLKGQKRGACVPIMCQAADQALRAQ